MDDGFMLQPTGPYLERIYLPRLIITLPNLLLPSPCYYCLLELICLCRYWEIDGTLLHCI